MAIYQTAFSVYIMFLSLTTSGIPFALSRYTAKERAFSEYGNICFSVKFSSRILTAIGLFASLVMLFFADYFALAMKEPNSAHSIRAISLAVLFVAIGEAYKSFYRGFGLQTPTALSQITEAFIKLAVGYFLAAHFAAFSQKYSSAAAIFGVTVGEFFATLVLMLMFIPFFGEMRHAPLSHSKKEIASELAELAIPMTLISLAGSALSLTETSVIRNVLPRITFDFESASRFLGHYSRYSDLFDNLLKDGHLSQSGAGWLFGAYSGYAATVFNLPIGIFASFGAVLLPVVTGAYARHDISRLKNIVSSACALITACCLPCAVLMCIFSREILALLFKNTASSIILSVMAPSLLVTALSQFLSTVMHAAGKIFTPFFFSLLCCFIRIPLSCILMQNPLLNICGASLASFLSGILYLFMCCIYLKKEGIFSAPPVFAKILISGVVTLLTCLLLASPLRLLTSSPFTVLTLSSCVTFAVYSGTLFLCGAKFNIPALR